MRAEAPFPLRSAADTTSKPLCTTRDVRGRLIRVLADTIVLEIESVSIEPQAGAEIALSCPDQGRVALTVGPSAEVTSQQVSTVASLTAVALVAAVAYLVLSTLGFD